MAVKDDVLKALESEQNARVSGAVLAEALSVSRNAVWKAIEALRQSGHDIESTRGGYRLTPSSDRLSAAAIGRHLTDGAFWALHVLDEVDSTNAVAKQLAAGGAREGTVVVAEHQTAGRGRLGRTFYSPEGTGAYFTLVVRPRMSAQQAQQLTTIAAVAVCEAIESVTGRHASIKWVNDVLLGGKKVCGILTEASLNLELGGLEYAVVGIGLNVRTPEGGVPDALKDIVGIILPDGAPGGARSRLVAEVLNRFLDYYRDFDARRWQSAYRARSAVIGRTIDVLLPTGTRRARALSIDDDCALIVRYEDGTEAALSSGEVSTRL